MSMPTSSFVEISIGFAIAMVAIAIVIKVVAPKGLVEPKIKSE